MKKIRPLVPLTLVAMLAGCATPRTPAPVVDRGTVTRSTEARPNEPARQNNQPNNFQKNADQRGFHTVRKGDTLLQIANAAGQNFRDLVVWNNLASADDIKVDQVLRVLPPDSGGAPGTPQASSVTVGTGVEVRPLGTTPNGAQAGPAAAPNTNGPSGEKKPDSEAAIADVQKPDPPAATASTPARPSDGKPVEKPGVITAPAAPEDDNIAWIWPTDGKVAAGFDDGKKGMDIMGKSGQQVLAASSGKVMYAGSGIRGYGNLVIVKHTINLLSAYAHNKSILVKEGQTVTKGQKIAEMGDSDSEVVKLHFEIRQQGKPVDPAKFLPAR